MQEIIVPKIGFRPLDGVVLFSLLIALSLNIVIWGECFVSIGPNPNAGRECILHWKIGGLRSVILVRAQTQHPKTRQDKTDSYHSSLSQPSSTPGVAKKIKTDI